MFLRIAYLLLAVLGAAAASDQHVDSDRRILKPRGTNKKSIGKMGTKWQKKTKAPSSFPSYTPSLDPSPVPSISIAPSNQPSDFPSDYPSENPSFVPSLLPSNLPSIAPSMEPSMDPSTVPSSFPSETIEPSFVPSANPTPTPPISLSIVIKLGNQRRETSHGLAEWPQNYWDWIKAFKIKNVNLPPGVYIRYAAKMWYGSESYSRRSPSTGYASPGTWVEPSYTFAPDHIDQMAFKLVGINASNYTLRFRFKTLSGFEPSSNTYYPGDGEFQGILNQEKTGVWLEIIPNN